MALSVQTVVLLAPGRNEFLIDTPPASHVGAQLSLNTGLWVGGSTAAIEIFYSYDGGLTFTHGVSALIDTTHAAPFVQAGRLHTAAQAAIDEANGVPAVERGFVTPTHARAAITFNGLAAVSTQVSVGWV
jgi:hypothetical protein